MLLGLSNEGYFLGDFWKISLGPPFALFQKMRVLGNVAKIAITWSFGTFFSLCIISGYNLQDNDICARVLLAFWSEGYFLGDFWKTSFGLPFALFLKRQVLNDFPKIAITSPLGPFLSRCLCLNLLQCLHFKCILIKGYCHCASVLLGLLNEGIFLGDIWKISFSSPFALFQKMRLWGDLTKSAITWPFGYYWSRC